MLRESPPPATAVLLCLCAAVWTGCPAPPEGPPASTLCERRPELCPDAPVAPAPPVLPDWTCPTGWDVSRAWEPSETDHPDGPTPPLVCVPPPITDCPPGEMRAPLDAGCAPVGAPCPAGDWPEGLPEGATVVWVREGGTGDGSSSQSPLGTLADGFAAAPDDGIVAVAKGTYPTVLELDRPVTLWGACARDVVVVAADASERFATLELTQAGAGLANLTVTGPRPGVWVWGNLGPVSLSGLWIRETIGFGLAYTDNIGGGTVRDLLVTDVDVRPSDEALGHGLHVVRGGQVSVARASLVRTSEFGVYAREPGVAVTLENLSVRQTRGRTSDGSRGRALQVRGGATVFARFLDARENRAAGLFVDGAGTRLELSDSLIADTLPDASVDDEGFGIRLEYGGAAQLDRVVFSGNRHVGLLVVGTGTTLDATDVVVRSTLANTATSGVGFGAQVSEGGTLRGTRIAIAGSVGVGLTAVGPARVELEDTVVRDTEAAPNGNASGRGFTILRGASTSLSRVWVERSTDVGLQIAEAGTTVTVSDLHVLGTRSNAVTVRNGHGFHVQQGAMLGGERVRLLGNRHVSAAVLDAETRVELTDLEIRETLPEEAGAHFGRGIELGPGAEVVLSRVRVDSSRDSGVAVFGEGASLRLSQALISETAVRERDGSFGHGVVVGYGAGARLEDVVIERSAAIGLAVSTGTLAMLGGAVLGNAIGLHVQGGSRLDVVESIPVDLEPLDTLISESTLFEDNELRVGTGTVPLPEPGG